MEADGGNLQNLTNSPFFDDSHPSWSPDSKRIAFQSNRDKDNPHKYQIYVMDTDGGNQQRLTENLKTDWQPSWSPNSERIAYASDRKGDFENFEIYVMDADGDNQRRLTENRHSDLGPAWLNSPFSVSPAGKKFMIWGQLKQVNR